MERLDTEETGTKISAGKGQTRGKKSAEEEIEERRECG